MKKILAVMLTLAFMAFMAFMALPLLATPPADAIVLNAKSAATVAAPATPTIALFMLNDNVADASLGADVGLNTTGIPQPSAPTVALVAGVGNINSGTHSWRISWLDAASEDDYTGAWANLTTVNYVDGGEAIYVLPVGTDYASVRVRITTAMSTGDTVTVIRQLGSGKYPR